MKQDFQNTTLWDQITATEDDDGKNFDPLEMEVYTKAFEKGVVVFRRDGTIEPLGEIVFKSHTNATDAILAFKNQKQKSIKAQDQKPTAIDNEPDPIKYDVI